jgi:acetyl esterase/lipase
VAWLLLFMIGVPTAWAGNKDRATQPATFVYKKVDDLEIKLDVYRSREAGVQPVVIWIHGGALIMGHRGSIRDAWREVLLDAGYVVVSIDYRLAPEVKAETIIGDVQDAYRWIRENGPELFSADPDKIAVAGGSAGGYLTLTSGFRLSPRPAALVSFYGYGEVVGEWYSQPYEPYRKDLVSKRDAYAVLSPAPISDDRLGSGKRGRFYMYCRQNGLWPLLVCGHDPDLEREAFRPLSALWNVDRDYPPTFMIHGTDDVDVPYNQSVQMSAQLRKFNVEHELVTIEGGNHGFSNVDPKIVRHAYVQAIEFLDGHLRP